MQIQCLVHTARSDSNSEHTFLIKIIPSYMYSISATPGITSLADPVTGKPRMKQKKVTSSFVLQYRKT